MKGRRGLNAIAVLMAGLVCLAAHPASATVSVATNDGTMLTLNDDGSWNSLTVDGNAVPELSGATGGFLVHRMEGVRIPYQRDAWYPGTLVTGTATQVGSDVQLTGSAEGLDFDITLSGGGSYIGVDGTVTGPGTDRIFLLYFRIPVDANGWLWANDVNGTETINSAPANWYFSGYHFHQARHPDMTDNPFGTITKTDSPAMGLSLTPLFYPPSAYSIQYNGNGGFWIEFELGVTPMTTNHPNTCDFHFVLYKHDPEWGNRSAVARYYTFFPQWFQRVSRGGNWMTDYGTRPTDPGDFSLVYFQSYLWDDQWITDNNLYGCKYQEPWCWHVDWTTEQAMEDAARDIPENAPEYCPAKGQSIMESAQSVILSGCKNPDGTYIGMDDQQYWTDGSWECGTTYRAITNPDPEIPNWRDFTINGEPGRNRAQSVMYWEWYREWGQEPGPGDTYSGLYHDSTGGWWAGWGVVHNFAPEHWATYDYSPGIYQGWDYDPGQICMWAPLSNVEFLKAAYEQMVLEDRVVIANSGPNYELFMVAPWLDMIGAGEGYSSDLHDHSIVRAIAAQKPCSFWGERTEAGILTSMLMGIYPGLGDGSNYESDRALYLQYMPTLDLLDEAGWEPITAARSSNANIYVERYGPDGNGVIYLVARSWSRRAATDITISSDDLGWPANPDVSVTELLYGGSISTSYDGDGNLVISTGTVNRKDNRVYKLVANTGPQPPVAEFSGNPTSGNAPLTVYFTDLSTGSPTSWSWDFGDTGSSQAQHPSHEYTAIDTYDVSLTATNAQGNDTETKIDYITVSNQSCHVGAIDLVGKEKTTGAPSGRGYYAEATITVHDQDCAVLAGVTVDITWSGCVSGSDSGVTDETGQVMFESPKNTEGGTFTCCVDNLTKDGYPYNSGANHETCDNIVNP